MKRCAWLIGEVYWKSKKSLVDAVRTYAVECGRMLLGQKEVAGTRRVVAAPWLEAHADVLGFEFSCDIEQAWA